MKCFVIIISILLCNCSPYLPYSLSNEAGETVLIQVEYKTDQIAEKAIIQALKLVRVNDIGKENNGFSNIIKARYKELSSFKAQQIKEDLQSISGVLDIQIIKDGMPVKKY